MTKTYSAKPDEVTREWYVVDASEVSLGRLAAVVSSLLTGKGKPMFTKHIDCGDYVVIVNSDKLKVTGNKMVEKKYYRHSGYPGNLKELTLARRVADDSTKVVEEAVYGMLPKNKLRSGRLSRLKICKGLEHKYQPQQPTAISLKEKN